MVERSEATEKNRIAPSRASGATGPATHQGEAPRRSAITRSSPRKAARCLPQNQEEKLRAYLWGIHKKLRCHLYRIGGVEDHLHLRISLPPTLALARYVEEVKTSSTNWIRPEGIIREWLGWQDGYGAFTASLGEKEALVADIKGQEEHHRTVSFGMNCGPCWKRPACPTRPNISPDR